MQADDNAIQQFTALRDQLWSLEYAIRPNGSMGFDEAYTDQELAALSRVLSKSAELLTPELIDQYEAFLHAAFPDCADNFFRYTLENIARVILYTEPDVWQQRMNPKLTDGGFPYQASSIENQLTDIDWWIECLDRRSNDDSQDPGKQETRKERRARLEKECEKAISEGIVHDRPLVEKLHCGVGTLYSLNSHKRFKEARDRQKTADNLAALKKKAFSQPDLQRLEKRNSELHRLIQQAPNANALRDAISRAAEVLGFSNSDSERSLV